MRNITLATAAFAALGLAACGGQSEPAGPALTPGESYDSTVEPIQEDRDPLQEPAPMMEGTQPWPNETPGMDDSLAPAPVDPLTPLPAEPAPLPGDPVEDPFPGEADPLIETPDTGMPAPEPEEEWPGPQ